METLYGGANTFDALRGCSDLEFLSNWEPDIVMVSENLG